MDETTFLNKEIRSYNGRDTLELLVASSATGFALYAAFRASKHVWRFCKAEITLAQDWLLEKLGEDPADLR